MIVDAKTMAERGVWVSDFEDVQERLGRAVGMLGVLSRWLSSLDLDASDDVVFAVDGIRQMLCDGTGELGNIEDALLERGDIVTNEVGAARQQQKFDAERKAGVRQ